MSSDCSESRMVWTESTALHFSFCESPAVNEPAANGRYRATHQNVEADASMHDVDVRIWTRVGSGSLNERDKITHGSKAFRSGRREP